MIRGTYKRCPMQDKLASNHRVPDQSERTARCGKKQLGLQVHNLVKGF